MTAQAEGVRVGWVTRNLSDLASGGVAHAASAAVTFDDELAGGCRQVAGTGTVPTCQYYSRVYFEISPRLANAEWNRSISRLNGARASPK